MKHFQYSVMGHGILSKSLGWVTKILGEIFSPPAHPSSCFMTSPLPGLDSYPRLSLERCMKSSEQLNFSVRETTDN